MLFRIDPGSPRPLFEQVAAAVRAEIVAGRLRPGDRIPAAREVAASLDINVHTVLHAYQDLRDEGLLDLRRGRGAVVAASAGGMAQLHPGVRSLVLRAQELGVPASALAALVVSTYAETPQTARAAQIAERPDRAPRTSLRREENEHDR